MPKASEIAAEFRKFAALLDRTPDAITPRAFCLFAADTKEEFLGIGRALLRPLKKEVAGENSAHPTICLTYISPAAQFYTRVAQSLTCELIEPAKPAIYRCDPILSDNEFAEVEA